MSHRRRVRACPDRALRPAIILALAAALLAAVPAPAAPPDDPRMDWWREARFGLFIHWGLYAIPAGEWKGSTNHAEWIRTTAQIPVGEYDRFLEQFNPVEFDADAWVRMAKDAGMKYIVITSKHHDGFALFDSAVSDFDVMSTPFRRDIMRELADACRREGLRICWYHSIMDWHHPDYLPRRGWEASQRPADGADLGRFVEYLHAQVTELLTRYGDIGVMWFDGEWEATWTHEHGLALYGLCRSIQPDLIVNNRVDKGRGGMAGLTTDEKYVGDFGTPEQEIPHTGLPGVDWETCMTMNRHWGWNRSDRAWKSPEQLVRTLIDVASKGGNFLLNVGPTPEGTFPAASVDRLAAIGTWMRTNGEAIHGTGASPFGSLDWGRCTMKAGSSRTTLYLHVFDWPVDGRLVVPGLGSRPRGARLLADPGAAIEARRDGGDVVIALPPSAPDPFASVVALEIEGAPVIYETPEIVADADILVNPLAVELRTNSPALAIHYTLDGSDPTAASPRYLAPILVIGTTTVKARAVHDGRPVSGVAERTFTRVAPKAAMIVAGRKPGLSCTIHPGDWNALPDFRRERMSRREVVPGVVLPPGPSVEYVGRVYEGFIDVPRTDVYRFVLTSDDGSRLLVDQEIVVDNDGLHGPEAKDGVVALARGAHRVRVEWFNKTGGAELDLRWQKAGGELVEVPAAAFGHE